MGDSITRQFFQDLIVLLTGDWQLGSLWDATLRNHGNQWKNANRWRSWLSGGEQKNIDQKWQDPVDQFGKGCRLNVILDTNNSREFVVGI